jgi:hypothetical protein
MSQQQCCPDLGFLIVFPDYHAGGMLGTGHAAAIVVNGRTGELRGYDFGPDDHVHKQSLGYVRKLIRLLTLHNCLPDCSELAKIMLAVSETFGIDGRHSVFASGDIKGIFYRMPPGSYEKSVAYAEDRARINEEYNRLLRGENTPENERLGKDYQYDAASNNCMTFALSVLNGHKAGRPNTVDWPSNDISAYQWAAEKFGAGIKFSYQIKTGKVKCKNCCKKTSPKEQASVPERRVGIPIGGGLYYEDPWSDY